MQVLLVWVKGGPEEARLLRAAKTMGYKQIAPFVRHLIDESLEKVEKRKGLASPATKTTGVPA